MTLVAWPARESELAQVMDLLLARVHWLQERGSDQWSTYPRWEPEMKVSIAENRTWLIWDNFTFEAVGTITFDTDGDTDFWTEEELKVPALYLAKLATSTSYRGRGIGRLILDFSLYQARALALQECRMDVWKSAHGLQDYYRSQGWTYLRTVEKPGRNSGALFKHEVSHEGINVPPSGLEIRPRGGVLSEYNRLDPDCRNGGTLHFDG
ncbi:GNAT family N-acetyltransferase [Amycolatopsis magusensis]|uniref:GNAT family N-acetyltransferase n=1 Tax=Amycolatopsis magusensis TaxID=882444 RepID=UPI0037AB06A7